MTSDQVWEDFFPDADGSAFDSTSIDALKSSPDVSSQGADAAFNYQLERQRAEIKRLKGENKMREKFFAWSSKLVGWVVGVNMAIFAGYLVAHFFGKGNVPESVMLGWIGATVTELIGIVYIVARHLFPGRKSRSSPSKTCSRTVQRTAHNYGDGLVGWMACTSA